MQSLHILLKHPASAYVLTIPYTKGLALRVRDSLNTACKVDAVHLWVKGHQQNLRCECHCSCTTSHTGTILMALSRDGPAKGFCTRLGCYARHADCHRAQRCNFHRIRRKRSSANGCAHLLLSVRRHWFTFEPLIDAHDDCRLPWRCSCFKTSAASDDLSCSS
jgi:hypothetical protein